MVRVFDDVQGMVPGFLIHFYLLRIVPWGQIFPIRRWFESENFISELVQGTIPIAQCVLVDAVYVEIEIGHGGMNFRKKMVHGLRFDASFWCFLPRHTASFLLHGSSCSSEKSRPSSSS